MGWAEQAAAAAADGPTFAPCSITSGPADSDGSATITTVPTPAPVATVGSATATSSSTATLTGTVSALGYPVSSCAFAYGLTTRLGSTTAVVFSYGKTNRYGKHSTTITIKAGKSVAVSISKTVTGLRAGTKYHARVTAGNASGSAKGTDFTFRMKKRK